jgi:hypothetical protein
MGEGMKALVAACLALGIGAARADDVGRLRVLANEGDARAQYDLGLAYQQGYAPAARLLKELEKL